MSCKRIHSVVRSTRGNVAIVKSWPAIGTSQTDTEVI